MPEGRDVVQTRQRPEEFFRTATPLASGAEVVSSIGLVDGYDSLLVFGVSDQAFQIVIEEALRSSGEFVVTATYSSSTSGGNQVVCAIHKPCGIYARATLGNVSGNPMSRLQASISGIAVG